MGILTNDIYNYILTVVLVTFSVVYIYYKWSFYYWRRRGVEDVPPSIPFGSASRVIHRKITFGKLFKEIYEKHKSKKLRYVGFYTFSTPALIILDIDLIKTILTKDFNHFTDHGGYVNEEGEPLTGHLFNLKGQKWRQLRAKLTPTFTSGKMKMMFHTLVDCSQGLKDIMDDIVKQNKPVEIKDVVARYTTDVIGSCAFGLECNSLKDPNSEFRKFGKRIFDISMFEGFVRFLGLVSPQLVAALGLKFLSKNVSDFFLNVVNDTVNYREKNNVIRNDFMHLLIQLKNNPDLIDFEDSEHQKNEEAKCGLTVNQIAAQALVFFIGGFETSSTTLTFCLFELVSNSEIQTKLRTEIKSILKKHDNNITYEAIMEMSYMDKCIQETLRKYPPLPLLFRECTENYKIPESDVCIEKGMKVFIPTLGVHHDPEYYPNPEEFDPERFSTENKANRDHFAWLPFGEGPRACIGLRFGLMQTKAALVALLMDYEFSLSNKTETPLVMSEKSIILTAKRGVWLNVNKLN